VLACASTHDEDAGGGDGAKPDGDGTHAITLVPARRQDGTFLVAGLDDGTVYTIRPDGTTTVLLKEIDGLPIRDHASDVVQVPRMWHLRHHHNIAKGAAAEEGR
jgi:hypothetical protein